MSITEQRPAQTITKRTHFVGRQSPVIGEASLYILREEIDEDGESKNLGNVFEETFSRLKSRPAAAIYLAACKAAVTLDDLFAAEKNLYDNLVKEKTAEIAAQKAARAALVK